MTNPMTLALKIFGKGGILGIWQIIALVALIGLIIFWVMYRKRQM